MCLTNPTITISRSDPRKRLVRKGKRGWEGVERRRVEMIRGKKRRPSPENSRSLRNEWGMIGVVRVWRVRERCLS